MPCQTLREAQAWVVEHYGPVKWEKRQRPGYNEPDEWWPTTKYGS